MSGTSIVLVYAIIGFFLYRKKSPDLHAASRFKMPGGGAMAVVKLIFLILMYGRQRKATPAN